MIFNQSIFLLLALALVKLVVAAPAPSYHDPLHKKNVIMVIPDGFGPSGLTLARTAKQVENNLDPIESVLNLDKYIWGNVRTRSASSLITDSAAAGTAYSTGFKTYNGAIGMDENKIPKGTLMEGLKLQGYKTGLVVKSTLTDATPSVWAAHVDDRDKQDEIAEQMIGEGMEKPFGQIVDYMSGGGKCWWVPQGQEDSCRKDDKDMIAVAKEKGFNYFETKEEFDDYLANGLSLPALSFWGNEDVDYAIDRNASTTPTLGEQAELALNTLSNATKDSDQGFFLMLEGSLIDHAGHANDPATHYRETIEFDEAFGVIQKFAEDSDVDTIVVVAADHETGGLALGWHDHPTWNPEVLFNVTHSLQWFSDEVTKLNATDADNSTITKFANDWITENLKIDNSTEEQLGVVLEAIRADDNIMHAVSPIISERAVIGWTSGGHTDVDILSFAYSNSEYLTNYMLRREQGSGLKGSQDNTNINAFLAEITGVDLEEVTKKLAA